MALSDTAARQAKPRAKAYKLADERGLLLLVNPNGGKLAPGLPEVSLDGTRSPRRLLADGKNPNVERHLERTAGASANQNMFAVLARSPCGAHRSA